MSYRVRFTFPNGATGVWALTHPTREDAQRAIDERVADTGLAYTVEEVAVPGESLAASRKCPAKASDAPGEGGDSGEGAK